MSPAATLTTEPETTTAETPETVDETRLTAGATISSLEDDFEFDEPLAPRACRLDDESCESCQ